MISRYTPPPINGYVFYSNFGEEDYHRVWTRASLTTWVASKNDIPESDVRVEIFVRPGTAWAVYVKDHNARVAQDLHDSVAGAIELMHQLHPDVSPIEWGSE